IASPVDHSSIYVYVCRHDIGHRLILAAGDGAGDYPYRVAVTGDQVAMAFGSGFEGCKGDTLIKVFNTRTAHQERCAGTTANAAPFGVWSLKVTARGSAAWIEQIGGAVEEPDSKDNPPDAFAVRVLSGRRARTLASDRSVRRTSLRLHGHTPQNWMTPPTVIEESEALLVVRKRAGASEDRLEIRIDEVLSDVTHDMGDAAALEKDGVEADLQVALADAPRWCGEGFRLVRPRMANRHRAGGPDVPPRR